MTKENQKITNLVLYDVCEWNYMMYSLQKHYNAF